MCLIVVKDKFIYVGAPRCGSRTIGNTLLNEKNTFLVNPPMHHPTYNEVIETKQKYNLPVYAVVRHPERHLKSIKKIMKRLPNSTIEEMYQSFLKSPQRLKMLNPYHELNLIDRSFIFNEDNLFETYKTMFPETEQNKLSDYKILQPLDTIEDVDPSAWKIYKYDIELWEMIKHG